MKADKTVKPSPQALSLMAEKLLHTGDLSKGDAEALAYAYFEQRDEIEKLTRERQILSEQLESARSGAPAISLHGSFDSAIVQPGDWQDTEPTAEHKVLTTFSSLLEVAAAYGGAELVLWDDGRTDMRLDLLHWADAHGYNYVDRSDVTAVQRKDGSRIVSLYSK